MEMIEMEAIVYVDPDIGDLIPDFLANRRRDVDALEEALGNGDFDSIALTGHSLKGVGGGFGFDAITDFGRAIEIAARERATDMVHRYVTELRSYLERVRVVLDAEAC